MRGCPVRGCSVRAWPALRTRLAVRAWLLTPCVRGWFCGAAVTVWLAGRAWLWDMAGGPACMGVCVWLRGGRAALRVLLALRGRWAAVMHPAAARPCMHLHGWSSVAPVAGNVCVCPVIWLALQVRQLPWWGGCSAAAQSRARNNIPGREGKCLYALFLDLRIH